MKYTKDEIKQYCYEDDVKFIRLAFCDVYGKQKNIAIMPDALDKAFDTGIEIDAASVAGFQNETASDLFLHPETETLTVLPWRPEHGKVVRMFTHITDSEGNQYSGDTRSVLIKAIEAAYDAGIEFTVGATQDFYLFELDENGQRTNKAYDNAGYMDIAPEDRGENVRREICLTLEQMGISPEGSHHENGPGQNGIYFRHSDPLSSADNVMTFQTIVKTVARRNGLAADFSAKPMEDKPGNGFHITLSVKSKDGSDKTPQVIAGIMEKISDITAFLNPTEASYSRFGNHRAPKYIAWGHENKSLLLRLPAGSNETPKVELRSPDPSANPYLSIALVIYAGLYGIKNNLTPAPETTANLYKVDETELSKYKALPATKAEASALAAKSDFVKEHLSADLIAAYCTDCQ